MMLQSTRRFLTVGLLAILALVALVDNADAVGSCSIFRSWTPGDSFTAGDATASFTTVGVTNMVPTCMDAQGTSVALLQTVVDPYPAATESLPTNLSGELTRLRFVLKNFTGWSQWYAHNANAATADRSALSQTFTWNNVAVTFGGAWKLNVTDTASAAGSLLMDLQVGGVSKFKVDKTGAGTLAGGLTATTGTFSGAISGTTVTGSGAGSFTNLTLTNNANQIAMGTTNVGTQTMAALTAGRTWTWPDITGTVFLTGGGQTVTSALWNGTAIGTQYGGTGGNFSATAQGNLWFFSGAGVVSALAPGTAGQVLVTNGAGANPSWGIGGVTIIDRVTADTTVANTVVETTIYSKSIAGGTLGTNIRLRLTLQCSIQTSGAGATLTIRLKYGASTIGTISLADDGITAFSAGSGYLLEAWVSGDGTTSAQISHMRGTAQAPSTAAANLFDEVRVSRNTSVEDSTVAKTLAITAQWSTAAVANTITMEHAILEQL